MTTTENIDIVSNASRFIDEARIIASSPSSTTSGEESYIEGISSIPKTLKEDELQLALNQEANAEELEKAIQRCHELVMETSQCSPERKWLVRHLIELRLRLQECHDALADPSHPRNKESSVNTRVILGHHLILQPFLTVGVIPGTRKIHCDHCTSTIWSMLQAWYQCSDCGYCCHHKCIPHIVRVCAHLVATEKGNYIIDICPEKGISFQKYQCAECRAPLTFTSTSWAEPRLCDYNGCYYCTACHWNSQAVIPARVIHNWDVEKRTVCQASAQLLRITSKQPLINLEKLNPKLFNFIHELSLVKKFREDLSIMRKYLSVCRLAQESHLLWKLGSRPHLIDTTYMYSLQDLVDTSNGELPDFLQEISETFVNHIKNDCEICKGRGHICEICGNDEVIFPFEDERVTCTKCNAVFHRACWIRKNENCPKCLRVNSNKVSDTDGEICEDEQ